MLSILPRVVCALDATFTYFQRSNISESILYSRRYTYYNQFTRERGRVISYGMAVTSESPNRFFSAR